MFLYLSKIAPLLLYPLGLACILALLAAAFRRWDSWSTALAVASALLLLIFSNGWVAGKLSKSLEWRYLPQDDPPAVDAIVLLGGGTRWRTAHDDRGERGGRPALSNGETLSLARPA